MRKLLVFLLAFALWLGIGVQAMAATSAINNLPGGAGVMEWMAAPDGTHTLLNVQNVMNCGPIAVHITFYDYNSNHLFDVIWPMSPMDNIGIAVTGDGSTVTLDFESNESPTFNFEQGLVHQHKFSLAGVGSNNLQYGYVTVAVTGVDPIGGCYTVAPAAIAFMAGNGDGNPMNDVVANINVVLPDMLVARAAILDNSGVLGLNGQMLQGFLNITQINEGTAVPFYGIVGADAACAAGTVDWNNDALLATATATDKNGIDIHAPELYITKNFGRVGIALNTAAAACTRNGRMVALGASNNNYWARYNVTPGYTDTSLVLVFPANSATAENPSGLIADPRRFDVVPYNDNEQMVSTPNLTGPEVIIAPFDSSSNTALPGQPTISHTTYTNGEALVTTRTPVFGYTYTTVSGVGSDIYPIVPQRIWVNVANIMGLDNDNAGGGPDVIQIP